MSINDHSTLQAAVGDWLARADLSARIPDFIALAEARLSRELRVRQMLASASGTITGGALALPADCRQVMSLRLGSGVELPPLAPEALQWPAGQPRGYVMIGNTAHIIGADVDVPYQLTYWQAVPPLSAGPNWLIQSHPDAYLYGALGASAPFLRDDERLVTWGALYRAAVDQIVAEDDRARYGNAPRARASGSTP